MHAIDLSARTVRLQKLATFARQHGLNATIEDHNCKPGYPVLFVEVEYGDPSSRKAIEDLATLKADLGY